MESYPDDRVLVWKFADAPEDLRAVHDHRETPEWIAHIPKNLFSEDLERAILEQSGPGYVRYSMDTGAMVFMGRSPLAKLLAVL